MPWVAPITGYVDTLGYLRCTECAGDRPREAEVVGDNSAYHGERCEDCGWIFPWLKTSDYVQVSWDGATPEYRKPVPKLMWAAE